MSNSTLPSLTVLAKRQLLAKRRWQQKHHRRRLSDVRTKMHMGCTKAILCRQHLHTGHPANCRAETQHDARAAALFRMESLPMRATVPLLHARLIPAPSVHRGNSFGYDKSRRNGKPLVCLLPARMFRLTWRPSQSLCQ